MKPPLTDEEVEKLANEATRAKQVILDKAGKARGVTGVVPCPNCEGGRLYYEVHDNGHVWARCDTEGCTAFLE